MSLFCNLAEDCFGFVGLFCFNLISHEDKASGIMLSGCCVPPRTDNF